MSQAPTPSETPLTDAFIALQEAGEHSIWAALMNIQDHSRRLERDRARLMEMLRELVKQISCEPEGVLKHMSTLEGRIAWYESMNQTRDLARALLKELTC